MKDTESLVKQLYPKVSTSLSKNTNKYRQVIARFIEKRSKDLYDIAPYAAGIPEFPIPFEKIETNTKEEYLNLIK